MPNLCIFAPLSTSKGHRGGEQDSEGVKFMDKVLFSELELSESTQLALTELGFEHASPIQAQAIPLVMSGRDVIGQAQTGTGKTAAYGIPMIEKLDTSSRKIGALIVCPTRELVMQVATELKKFAKHKKPGISVQA